MNVGEKDTVYEDYRGWWFWQEQVKSDGILTIVIAHYHGPFETESHAQKTLDFLNR